MSLNKPEPALPKHALAIVVSLATTGLVSIAQANDDAYTLDKVVVTATRTAQTVDETLAPVTVITRKEIERSQATDVTELLKKVPGVQINRNGGPGSITTTFIRGASSSQTLVLIDGQRLNNATAGTPEFQYLNPDQIDRIEVVRGPRSSLYGADAMGGVIQIFTRKGQGDPQLTVKAGTGSRHTNELGLNYGGKTNNTRYNLAANFYETSGFDSTNDKFPANSGANLDDDAYRNKSITANVSHKLHSGVEVGVSYSHQQGKAEYDGYVIDSNFIYHPFSPYTLFKTTTLNTYASMPVNNIWLSRIDVGYSEHKSKQLGKNDSPSAPYTPNFYETRRISALWQNDIEWSDTQLLTTGIDFYQDKVDGSTVYQNPGSGDKEDSRYNVAGFIQNQSEFGWSDLQLGLRRDKNEAYGYQTTGNIAWGFELPKSMRLIASYGTAYRAPTFNDLYYPDSGNPNLKPESSKNSELELRGQHNVGKWSVSLFQNDIDDLIAWAPTPSGLWKPSNVDKARIRGIEASISTTLKQWDITASVTLLDPKDTRRETILQRRAKQYMTLDADRSYGKFSLGGTFKAQGHSYDDVDNNVRVAGFATIDVRTAYKINKELTAQLKATNLLDKKYQTANGYNAEPSGFFLSLIWKPAI